MSQERKDFKLGRNLLRAMMINGRAVWKLYDHNKKLLGEGNSLTFEEAKEDAGALISTKEAEAFAARKNGIPSSREYAEALNAVVSSKSKYWDILKAHFRAPQRMMTSAELADAAGYSHFSAANSHYGRLGHEVADFLNFTPPGRYDNGDVLWITALVTHNPNYKEEDTGHWKHEMRPELAEALELLGNI